MKSFVTIVAALLPVALLAADDVAPNDSPNNPCPFCFRSSVTTIPPEYIVHIPDRTERDCYQVFAREILEDGKHYGFDIRYGQKISCSQIGEKEKP